MHVAFIGFGLIAGSIARALRAHDGGGGWTLAAWSPSGLGPARAASDGVLDRAATSPGDALADAELVILAGPPTACLAAMDDLAGALRGALPPNATITDVASTKRALMERAEMSGLRYVGGHPMAGLDVSGYSSSDPDLFVDRPWVVSPSRASETWDVERVTMLAEACRAKVVRLEAGEHDRLVAGISHLPLLLSAALVESVAGATGAHTADWPQAAQLAAGGWRDMTRLARGDAAMGAGIMVTNADAVADRLRELTFVLERWLEELGRGGGMDETAIANRLEAARRILQESDRS